MKALLKFNIQIRQIKVLNHDLIDKLYIHEINCIKSVFGPEISGEMLPCSSFSVTGYHENNININIKYQILKHKIIDRNKEIT